MKTKITKEIIKSYLDFGLISSEEANIILKKTEVDGVNDKMRVDLIKLLESNIKRNEDELVQIDEELIGLDKKDNENFNILKQKAKNIAKCANKEKFEKYKQVKKQQEEIVNDFELEMDRLDRKLDEIIAEKKVNLEKNFTQQIREKLQSI